MRPLLRSSSTPVASWIAGGLLAAALLATTQSSAQPTTSEHSAADVTMARQLGNEGLELAQAGNCTAAVDPLSRSEAMHHAPTTLTVLGECHITLGKLVEGAEELTRVVRENIDPQAPASFRTAQDRARVRLEETRPRIPKLRLTVRGAGADAALTIRCDGEAIPVASLGIDRPVDPGRHRVEVTAGGYSAASGEVTLREGETGELSLELVRLPESETRASSAGRDATSGASSTALAASPHGSHSTVPAKIAFGVGVAGIAAGSVFGVITLSKTSSLDQMCPTRSACPATAQSEINAAKTTALTSTISFGVGAAGVLTGLFFALRGSGSEPAAAAASKTFRPWLGLGSAGFDGSF
jgi:hypothetical protein